MSYYLIVRLPYDLSMLNFFFSNHIFNKEKTKNKMYPYFISRWKRTDWFRSKNSRNGRSIGAGIRCADISVDF
jgi:hypothetical protein